MLWKKLVTLASVLGILSFGACFWPAPSAPTTPAPAPPLRLDLHGIRTIQVTASNLSDSKHIVAADLAQAVANNINSRRLGAGVRAQVQTQTAATDTVLQITILGESADPPDRAGWAAFMITMSATLTRQDGQVIWRETNGHYGPSERLPGKDSADLWKEPKLQSQLLMSLSDYLIYRMLYTI